MGKIDGKHIMIAGICLMLVGIVLMGYRIVVMMKEGTGSHDGYPMLGLLTFLTGVGVSLYGYIAGKR